jgi:membrane-associated protease RseP (regulator of RpoE activity)
MPTLKLHRLLALTLAVLVLPACTTMQTTYFRGSYQEFAKADDPMLLPYKGQPGFSQADDMAVKARAMQTEGYAMLGYSQFISPLLTSLAESYSTKWGEEVGAAHVVLETPRPGASNLHYYLVTYWRLLDPAGFGLGASLQDLPEELLKRIGESHNLVIVLQVVPGTPAAAAGLRADDVIVEMDGEYVQNARTLTQRVASNRGKEVLLGISRKGESLEIAVRLATPKPQSGTSTANYQESPWLDTQPRDWSGLSAGNLAAANMAATQQRIQQDRQLFNERLRVQAQRNQQALAAQGPAASGPTSRRGGGASEPVTDRRGGGQTRAELNPAGRQASYVMSPQQQAELWKQMSKTMTEQMDRKALQAMQIWLENAPNAYGGMAKLR